MIILYKNLASLRMYATPVDFTVWLSDDQRTLRCELGQPEDSAMQLSPLMFGYVTAEYNGVERNFEYTDGKYYATFDYANGIQTLKLYCDASSPSQKIYYNDVYYGYSFPVSWGDPSRAPRCSFAPSAVYEDYGNRLTWQFESPAGDFCAAVGLWYYEEDERGNFVRTQLISGKYTRNSYTHTLPAGKSGKRCYYRLSFGSYASAGDAMENYLIYGEVQTEVFTIGATAKYPAAPAWISCTNPVAGGSVKISWSAVADEFNEVTAYTLARKYGGGNWVTLYEGSSTSFPADRIPLDATSVVYRVRSVDAEGDCSEWKVGDVMTVIQSNLYVKHQGRVYPSSGVVVGGMGTASSVVYVGGV